jgi:hypothetical protein
MKYTYTREIIDGNWNVDNPNRKDLDGNQIYLIDEVQGVFPHISIKSYVRKEEVLFIFEAELSLEQKASLDTCVYNHKNNI